MIDQPEETADDIARGEPILDRERAIGHGRSTQLDVSETALAHVRPALPILLRLTGAKTAQKLVRVELDAARVLGKCLRVTEGGRSLDLGVIVELQFDLVNVRLGIDRTSAGRERG